MSDAAGSFELTEDQAAIRQMALDFAAAEIAPHALDWDRDKFFPIEVIKRAAGLGMAAIYCSDDYGGTGLGRVECALIIEALATGCPAVSSYISIHNMVAGMIDRFGSDEQKSVHLPDLASMAKLASYCLTEPGSGSDAAALKSSAVPDGNGWRLNGVKQFISGAGDTDFYLVMARSHGPGPKGISAFLIDKDTPGLSFGANERKMGWHAQPTRQVIMEDVRIPGDRLLGEPGAGFKIAMTGLDGGRLNIGAASLGGAQAALDRSLAYMTERQAFGKKLNEFQALQFKLAEMATELEAGRLMIWSAAAALDAKRPDATRRCAMAKLYSTDAGFRIANEALQLHGGYGYLADYGVEKLVRDLRVHQILEGTNEIMRHIIARDLIGRVA